jgi:WD40 repeat protein
MINHKAMRYIPVIIAIFSLSIFVSAQSEPRQGNDADSITWSHNNLLIAVGQMNNTIIVRYTNNNRNLCILNGHTDRISMMAFDNQATKLASASGDGTVRIWNLASCSILRTLTGHNEPVFAVTWSLDNQKVISIGMELEDNTRIWNISDGSSLPPVNNPGSIIDLQFKPDNSLLLGGSYGRKVSFISPTTYTTNAYMYAEDKLNAIDWHPFNPAFAVGQNNGKVIIYSSETGLPIRTFIGSNSQGMDTIYLNSAILDVKYSIDGNQIMSVAYDGGVRVWNANTGVLVASSQLSYGVYEAAFSPDGLKLAYDTLTSQPQIVPLPASFTHINTDTDTSIQALTSGNTLNLGTLPTRNLKRDYTLTATPYDDNDVPATPTTISFAVTDR